MSKTAQAVLEDFKRLPSAEQVEVSRQIERVMAGQPAETTSDDPIRSARGMFAGSGLGKALLASRAEERRRG